ncbi:MAG: hypothetical protein JOZ32_03990 [Bryobacterales bacterium]|nr:hypothetical protein [Bryobacterales bacterium]
MAPLIKFCFALLIPIAAFGQSAAQFQPPRLPDGHPNLQGVWRNGAIVAAFNVQGQPAYYNEPGGASVIIDPPDGKLPYLPEAAAKAKDNTIHRERDPVGHCHPHGVPRTMVPPFPLEIVQDGNYVLMLFETSHDVRIIRLDGRPNLKNYWSWEGDSRGRWEGDTLVVDVKGLNGKSWLDQGGNLVDENEHVVERLTMTAPDTILYEARVDDPTIYSRPWTLRIPLRRQPKGTELIEYDCVEGERDEVHFPGGSSSKP